MTLRKIVGSLLALILAVLVTMAIIDNERNREALTPTPAPNSPPSSGNGLTSTAKLYTSNNLGITFTYESQPAEMFEVTVTERDNKIYLHGARGEQPEQGKLIEVFSKDPNSSLNEALKNQFLKNLSEQDCFVESIPHLAEDPRPDNYQFAEIAYPPPSDPNQPFWQNAEKCPMQYSRTNAVQYFMYNPDIPNKFVFLRLGQDSITNDGRANIDPDQRYDWSASIRIFK